MDASLFCKTYMDVGNKNLCKDMSYAKNYELSSKKKLAKKVKPFTMKEGIMYKMGKNNKMHRCLTTLETLLQPQLWVHDQGKGLQGCVPRGKEESNLDLPKVQKNVRE